MSLLMDALKRAEENKQGIARPGDSASLPVENGLSLEPLNGSASSTPPPQSLPDLASHIDAVDADLAAVMAPASKPPASSPPPSSTLTTPAPSASREAARAMFAAKEPPRPSRAPLYLSLVLLGLAGLGIGIYFWLQLQTLGGGTPNRPTNPTPPIVRTTPLPIAPSPTPPPAAPAARSEPPLSNTAAFRPEPQEREVAAPIRLTRTRSELDPNLSRGWRNLQLGALDAARQDYEQALSSDPKNVDALLALAAIAQRQGRQSDAERLQQLANIADPKDAAAQAALINQSAAADPQAAESRLKTLLAEQPQSAALNFALGNLYARQGRWADTQQAYFNAVAIDSDNPDYLFNLAISLDRLRQPKIAIEYYRQALTAAEKHPPAFEREQVRLRLNQLMQTLPP